LGAAVDYLENIGMDKIREHEIKLNEYFLEKLKQFEQIQIIGPKEADKRAGLVSFFIKNIHAHDIASVLNGYGIAVRSGHHCVMPYHVKNNFSATTRVSYYLYNTEEELDKLIEGLKKAFSLLS
jgi:cysteine desulfurase / selenocysteine lyase